MIVEVVKDDALEIFQKFITSNLINKKTQFNLIIGFTGKQGLLHLVV